jgi:hypothetical protein
MSDIAFIFIGSVLHAVTFTAGILIGASLRKDARHDNDSYEGTKKDQKWWHDPVGPSIEGGIERRGGSSANEKRAARIAERAAFGRGPFWE